jgi:hypothetical protein
MLVIGGVPNYEGLVYGLNLETMEWIKFDDVHYERYGHTANILENDIILFGGKDSKMGLYNDILVYNFENKML